MKLQTAINHHKTAQERVNSLFNWAIAAGHSHEKMLESLTYIRESIKHCPRWVSAKIESQYETLFQQLYKSHLVFCYVINGEIKPSKSLTIIEVRECCNGHIENGYYWMKESFTMSEDQKQFTRTYTLTNHKL